MKAAIYARYSSALQKATSVKDQVALCRGAAPRFGCQVDETAIFTDEEVSGSITQRAGYQRLLKAAERREFDSIIVEAQDRLWRDQAETHIALRRLRYWEVKVFSVETGAELTDKAGAIVAAVTGWRDETFLDSVREKTHRGMLGQVQRGLSPGGRAYGYRSEPIYHGARKDTYGRPEVLGYRKLIDPAEAEVIRRIFQLYVDGLSPKAIARKLNEEGVTPPRWRNGTPQRGWTWTTIAGSPERALGILNNPLYIGRVVWNRSRKARDPDSGKRVMRIRPETEWVHAEAQDLRIVPDELWRRVQGRRAAQQKNSSEKPKGRPLRHMFSGLLRCGLCNAPYVIKSGYYYGCSSNINRGKTICSNTRLVRRDNLETKILTLIHEKVFSRDAIQFITDSVNETLLASGGARHASLRSALVQAQAELEHIKAAIRQGIITPTTKAMLEEAERRIARLETDLRDTAKTLPKTRVVPKLIDAYLRDLRDVMGKDPARARTILRTLIGEVTLEPNEEGLAAVVQGNLEGILDLSGRRCDTHGAGRGI